MASEKTYQKPSEFRIGNLILFEKEVYTIDEITPNYIHAGPLGVNSLGLRAENYGMPITEEWLTRFYLEYSEGVDDCTIYSLGDFYIYRELDGEHFQFEYYNNNIIYVHQLQNLYFALTGEELQLKPQTV